MTSYDVIQQWPPHQLALALRSQLLFHKAWYRKLCNLCNKRSGFSHAHPHKGIYTSATTSPVWRDFIGERDQPLFGLHCKDSTISCNMLYKLLLQVECVRGMHSLLLITTSVVMSNRNWYTRSYPASIVEKALYRRTYSTMFVCSLCQQDVKKNVSKRVQLLGSAGYEYVTILGKCGGADSWRRVASIDPSQSVAVLRLSVRLDDFPDRVQNWEYCGNLSRRRSVNCCTIIEDFTSLSAHLSYVDAVLQHSLEPFQARNDDFRNSSA